MRILMSLILFGAAISCAQVRAQPSAGGFTVSPIRLEMQAGARAISLQLGNGADRTKTVQVEAVRWTQVDGQDRYESAPELVINPPLFRVAPGAHQVVRAGFRGGAPDGAVERAYRLYLQELPDGDEPPTSQLRLLLRIGVPLFVAPHAPVKAVPRWTLARGADGAVNVQLHNDGGRRLRIDALDVAAAGSTGSQTLAGLNYVLPGQVRRWALPAQFSATPLQLSGNSDAGPVDVALAPP
ncbi:MAG: phytochrome sensor protein [Panacagrimonas sp.]|jgi:fimbrial chaperone protein|nr:phytochrome sensor protein [Panacagrimonas sp.]